MNQNEAWNIFEKSGKIQDYLNYKNFEDSKENKEVATQVESKGLRNDSYKD